MLIEALIGVVLLVGAFIVVRALIRDDLAVYDLPLGQRFVIKDAEASKKSEEGLKRINSKLRASAGRYEVMSFRERILYIRQLMDEFFNYVTISSKISSVMADTVPSEWVLSPNADPDKRLLYIHGGAFFAGSPKSHRVITSRLSETNNCAVLSIDYRLIPENKRSDCVADCEMAYKWMLENGPLGRSSPSSVFVAGDSAGGNLALVLVANLRDMGLRPPNAVLALSPITDGRYINPSIKGNLESDVMLKSLVKRFAWIPRPLIGLVGRFLIGEDARDSMISPLLGDLSNLPPMLIQASEVEILRDDARRYINKAVASGVDARLQLWANMPHVFQIFYPELPESDQAFTEISRFLESYC
jgi:acetyl esterase/lipase